MVMAPSRLEQDFSVRFATVRFQGHGRGNGSCRWEWGAKIPDRDLILTALREKLTRCLDMLDLELGFSELPPLFSASTLLRPVPKVRSFSRLWPGRAADLTARFNPILS